MKYVLKIEINKNYIPVCKDGTLDYTEIFDKMCENLTKQFGTGDAFTINEEWS